MSTYQSAIQNLIADNQAQVARTKAINNDIAKMEVSRYEQNMKLAKLGAKSATKFIGDFHTMRMENLQSEAYNDFFENQYKDYLNSDEAGEAETILGEAHESSTIYHAELGQARADGVSGDLIEKAYKKHPMYGATIAKLQLRQEANKFEGYIRTAMAKDTTMLALPGVIDPSTNDYFTTSVLIFDTSTTPPPNPPDPVDYGDIDLTPDPIEPDLAQGTLTVEDVGDEP